VARLHSDFQKGTLSAALVDGAATTLTSAALAGLPAVTAPVTLALTLDPLTVGGSSEIVWVTAHTGGATTATIARAKEGTTARAHAVGIEWRHAPTALDYVFDDSYENVRAHGAVGDGGDDLAAIQAAIDALPATGGVVWFPPGEYGISDSIIIDADRVVLRGMTHGWWEEFILDADPGHSDEGPGVSKIKALATGFNLIEIHNTGALARRAGLAVENLYLVGNDYSSWAIYSDDDAAEQEALFVERCMIHKTSGGINVKSDSMRVNKCHIMDIGINPSIQLRTGWFVSITDNTIADNSGDGVVILSMTGPIITGNVFARIERAIVMSGGIEPIIQGNHFYDNRDTDVVLDNVKSFDISGNHYEMSDSNRSAIEVGTTTLCKYGQITGNTLSQYLVTNAAVPIKVGNTSVRVGVFDNCIIGDLGGGWTSGGFLRADKKVRTAGHVVFSSTSWTDVDTALDIELFGTVGDWVKVTVAGVWDNEAVYCEMDARSWVSGAAVNSWAFDAAAGAGALGVSSWKAISGQYNPIGGSIMRRLTAADLVDNTVTLRLQARTITAANKTLFASTVDPFTVMAENLGQGG
jgi:hypothetical protein